MGIRATSEDISALETGLLWKYRAKTDFAEAYTPLAMTKIVQ
ncbi:MAG TPA: hypothetical protein VL197_08200 [Nitrospirota bacterium]|nr:hypothetical protein [Nitrospirota bacterium]